LIVSWDVRKKKTSSSQKKIDDDDIGEFPSLMNLRKVANQWRNA